MKKFLFVALAVLLLSFYGPSLNIERPWPAGAEEGPVGGGFPYATKMQNAMTVGLVEPRTDGPAVAFNLVFNSAAIGIAAGGWRVFRKRQGNKKTDE